MFCYDIISIRRYFEISSATFFTELIFKGINIEIDGLIACSNGQPLIVASLAVDGILDDDIILSHVLLRDKYVHDFDAGMVVSMTNKTDDQKILGLQYFVADLVFYPLERKLCYNNIDAVLADALPFNLATVDCSSTPCRTPKKERLRNQPTPGILRYCKSKYDHFDISNVWEGGNDNEDDNDSYRNRNFLNERKIPNLIAFLKAESGGNLNVSAQLLGQLVN